MRRSSRPRCRRRPPGSRAGWSRSTGYFRLRTWAAAHGEAVPDARALPAALLALARRPGLRARLRGGARAHPGEPRPLLRALAHAQPGARASRASWSSAASSAAARRCSRRRPSASAVGERPLHLVEQLRRHAAHHRGRRPLEEGDLGSTSAESVRAALAPFPFARVHEGVIPGVLDEVGAERVAWAHIDVNIYAAVRDCLEYLYPRMAAGGTIVLDDYGFPSCPGARRAVDEFFAGRPGGAALPSDRPMPHRQAAVAAAGRGADRGAALLRARPAAAARRDAGAGAPARSSICAFYFWTAYSGGPGDGLLRAPSPTASSTARRTFRTPPPPELLALPDPYDPAQNEPVPAPRREPLRGPLVPLLRPRRPVAPLPAAAARSASTSSDAFATALFALGRLPLRAGAHALPDRALPPPAPRWPPAPSPRCCSASANVAPVPPAPARGLRGGDRGRLLLPARRRSTSR